MPRIIPLLLATILLLVQQGQTAGAQQKRYIVEGRICTPAEDVMRDGQLVTSLPRPIPGAVVSLITPTDTLNMISDGMGEFLFRKVTDRHFRLKVQQVSSDDMLADVMERLPGISVSNNLVEIMNEQVARIYIDGRFVFGDDVGNPLRYLAGS